MAVYVILSRISPGAFEDPKDFKKLATTVSAKIKNDCPGVKWRESFVTTGRFDIIDVVESEDIRQVEKAAMIIRGQGHCETEILFATPWKEYLAHL